MIILNKIKNIKNIFKINFISYHLKNIKFQESKFCFFKVILFLIYEELIKLLYLYYTYIKYIFNIN